jgi:hypothetical protein
VGFKAIKYKCLRKILNFALQNILKEKPKSVHAAPQQKVGDTLLGGRQTRIQM